MEGKRDKERKMETGGRNERGEDKERERERVSERREEKHVNKIKRVRNRTGGVEKM